MTQDFYKNKTVFVAGGAGLIGQSSINQLLEKGAFVIATQYKKRKITKTHPNLTVVDLDLSDETGVKSFLKDSDILLLCGAKVGGAKSIINKSVESVVYNLPLHFNLMRWAVECNVDRVGFISSSYVYPDTGKPNIEPEGFIGDPWKPLNYGLGWMKRYLETVCKFFHMNSKTRFAIIRPTSIYGPHDNFDFETCHAIPALVRRFSERISPMEVWGNGKDIRCHTYVDDVANGFLEVVDKYAVGEALNICNEEESTITKVVETLSEIENFYPGVKYHLDKPSVIPYKSSSSKLAKELIGWKAKVSLKDGLKKTLDWYKESLIK